VGGLVQQQQTRALHHGACQQHLKESKTNKQTTIQTNKQSKIKKQREKHSDSIRMNVREKLLDVPGCGSCVANGKTAPVTPNTAKQGVQQSGDG
jgi:hypothetical protein